MAQVSFAEDDDMVKTFPPVCAENPIRVGGVRESAILAA